MEHIGFATIKLLILPFYKYWFIIVYILLFILSPILNAGIESLNRVQSVFLTVFFTAFFCCLGFVSEATFISLNDGYSLMFAMYLYFLGRMMNKWKLLANSHFLRTAGPHFPDNPGHIKRTALETSRTERRLRPANQY